MLSFYYGMYIFLRVFNSFYIGSRYFSNRIGPRINDHDIKTRYIKWRGHEVDAFIPFSASKLSFENASICYEAIQSIRRISSRQVSFTLITQHVESSNGPYFLVLSFGRGRRPKQRRNSRETVPL